MLERTFKKYMKKYLNYSYTIVFRILIPPYSIQDVEDIVADVFESVWRNISKIDIKNGNIKSYIGSISRNKSINFLKLKENGNIDLNDELIIEGDNLEEKVIKEILEEKVREEVSKMNEPEREIVIRYYFYYQKISQISKEMDIPENTVKSKLYRSRALLKDKLSEVINSEI